MRNLVHISAWTRTSGEFVALSDDGSLWHGKLVSVEDGDQLLAVQWTPLPGPPDGDYWNKMKPFWDRMEEKFKREAPSKNQP